MLEPYDCVIVGAGLIGHMTAYALASMYPEKKLALIGPVPEIFCPWPLAIPYHSLLKLKRWNLNFPELESISKLYLGIEGYEVSNPYHPLGYQIFPDQWSAVFQKNQKFDSFPYFLISLEKQKTLWSLCLQGGQRLHGRFLIATDGKNSQVRQLLGDRFAFETFGGSVYRSSCSPLRNPTHSGFAAQYFDVLKKRTVALLSQGQGELYQVHVSKTPLVLAGSMNVSRYCLRQTVFSDRVYFGTAAQNFLPTTASGIHLSLAIIDLFLHSFLDIWKGSCVKPIQNEIQLKQNFIDRLIDQHQHFAPYLASLPRGLLKKRFENLVGHEVEIQRSFFNPVLI